MPFWNSFARRFLDRNATIAELGTLAMRAAARDPRIERVVLFGSLATGRATIRSDADLLIVLSEHHEGRWGDRLAEYLGLFSPGPLPIDVFPFTAAEVARRLAAGDRFVARIESEGIEIFRRGDPATYSPTVTPNAQFRGSPGS